MPNRPTEYTKRTKPIIEVTDVILRILDASGAPIESGPAIKDHGVWTYHTTAIVLANARWQSLGCR